MTAYLVVFLEQHNFLKKLEMTGGFKKLVLLSSTFKNISPRNCNILSWPFAFDSTVRVATQTGKMGRHFPVSEK